MASGQLHTVLQHLRRLIGTPEAGGVPDADLLSRFVSDRDEAAFELLVRRHERLVLNVCRRVLGHAQDAEDAFQATFLVLARKAAAVGRREALAGWLYRVAYRVALKARVRTARHGTAQPLDPERLAAPPSDDPETAADWRDLRPLLDEEVNRLPEKYRVPVVLCYLQSRTYDEAARQLGLSRGTVSTRLTRARDLLRRRLARRGLAVGGGLLAALLTERAAEAAASAALLTLTVRAGVWFATGAAGPALVSPQAATLAKGALHAMLLTQLKTAAAVLTAVLFVGTGTGLLAYRAAAAGQPASKDEPPPQEQRSAPTAAEPPPATPKPPPAAQNVVDGWQELPGRMEHEQSVLTVAFSPDGKLLASGSVDGAVKLWDVQSMRELRRFSSGNDIIAAVAFSPDGRHLFTAGGQRGHESMVRRWEVATGTGQDLVSHPDIAECAAVSPDGRLLAWGTRDGAPQLTNLNDDKTTTATLVGTKLPVLGVAFSPDAKVLVSVGGSEFIKPDNPPGEATLWDVASFKIRAKIKGRDTFTSVAFSPDGRTFATGSYDKTAALWDAASGKELRRLAGHEDVVRCVAFSPDGRTLATGGFDEDVKLWDVATGKTTATLRGHMRAVMAVAFSPDGRTLAVGTGSPRHTGRVVLWRRTTPPPEVSGPAGKARPAEEGPNPFPLPPDREKKQPKDAKEAPDQVSLDPVQSRLDRYLLGWQNAFAKAETVVAECRRTEENKTQLITRTYTGTFKRMRPDKLMLEMRQSDKPANFEKIVISGRTLYQYLPQLKEVQAHMLPPSTVKEDSEPRVAWPLDALDRYLALFCTDVAKTKQWYDMKLEKDDEYYAYISFRPRQAPQWFEWFCPDIRVGRIVLDKKTSLLRQLWFECRNRDAVTWDIPKMETDILLRPAEFIDPQVPSGWKMIRVGAPGQ
jgi:RNA polymerase sigma factor (sigma-70 family)